MCLTRDKEAKFPFIFQLAITYFTLFIENLSFIKSPYYSNQHKLIISKC
jgi:hypothetical protein